MRDRLDAAASIDLDDYLAAQAERAALADAFLALFDQVDVLVAPVAASAPATIDTPDVEEVVRQAAMPFTVPHDLLGVPACAVRAGFGAEGLPVAIQIAGPVGADARVLEAVAWFHAVTQDVQGRRPSPEPRP